MKNSAAITIVLLVLFCVFMANSCVMKEDENHHRTIEVINNSEKAIYTNLGMSYPDTLFEVGVPSSSEPSIYKVVPHERNRSALNMARVYWETIFKDGSQIPSDTLMVYIYDAELMDSKTFDHIYNTVIQRYDLSLQDLQWLNWKISYPPSEEMKNIKMYPPYKKE